MILPYLELPVCIGYGEGTESKVVKGKFQPSRITAYHQGYYDEVGMFIYQDGQLFQINLTIELFEDRLKQYWSMLQGKQSIKDKLRMVQ
jgi:hypothetical protein